MYALDSVHEKFEVSIDPVPESLQSYPCSILGDQGAVSRVDKMFMVKVFCKIDLTVTFTANILLSRLTAPGMV